ncbi:hypothetical protein VTP01DRAFT_641 [Rhizomucor pusillus]|uniref:uncharacterized protein n=1 Tax=Rhizomucor pusillus TaxID=4840 RepID=UPI00374495DD
MGKKKNAKDGPSQQHLQAYQRMNFLHQAAVLMTTIVEHNSNDSQRQPSRSKHVWQGDPKGSLAPLGRYYNNTMKKISRKLVSRVDPSIKRSVCKRCDTTLIPGRTASVRITSRPQTATVTQCNICGCTKHLLAGKKHELFNEKNALEQLLNDDKLD